MKGPSLIGCGRWCSEVPRRSGEDGSRQVGIDSPAFFDLLRAKTREQVRKDPRQCLEWAELALEHLEANRIAFR